MPSAVPGRFEKIWFSHVLSVCCRRLSEESARGGKHVCLLPSGGKVKPVSRMARESCAPFRLMTNPASQNSWNTLPRRLRGDECRPRLRGGNRTGGRALPEKASGPPGHGIARNRAAADRLPGNYGKALITAGRMPVALRGGLMCVSLRSRDAVRRGRTGLPRTFPKAALPL